MSSQILSATNKHQPGISFHYKFPKTGLSLRSVVIEEDGLPKLLFDAANCRELPTLTEEDVATVARVVMEGKRPEFFYTRFDNPFHPFTNLARPYKQYCPQYLRGTSVGELLSEADWSMKCLHVGMRSNESKTEFWSWQETSKLENLAVHMDFLEDKGMDFRVLMSCDHVKTEESENEILFTEEPKMRITDHKRPMYSEYITHYYDSVAYYDEPWFLKMQELMKLIVAVEWMKEKGVVFNEKWLKFHTEKRSLQVKEVIPFPLKEEETDLVVNDIFQQSQMPNRKIRKTPSGIEYTQTHETNDPPVHSKVVTKVRASYNDYDFLLEEFNCNAPITVNENGKPLIPDVRSWSELYGETIPNPTTVVAFKDETIQMFNGGVMTRNTQTKVKNVERVTNYTDETVGVKASNEIRPQTKETEKVPKFEKPTRKPPTDMSPNTVEALRNKELAIGKAHGTQYRGGHRLQTETMRSDQQRLKWSRVDTTTTNGKTETKGTLFVDQKTAITTKRYNDEDTCMSIPPTDSRLSSPFPNEILPVPPIPAATGTPQYNTGIPKTNGPPSTDSGYSSSSTASSVP